MIRCSKHHDSTCFHTYESIHSHLMNTGVPSVRSIGIASVIRRAHRVLTSTHLGTYRVVLAQPHDRRTGVVLNLSYVITVTRASLRAVLGEAVGSISRAQSVVPAGSFEHHTPRYIPGGPHTAARSTNGCCTQPMLRHEPLYHAHPCFVLAV